jgi:hypothetical protein
LPTPISALKIDFNNLEYQTVKKENC